MPVRRPSGDPRQANLFGAGDAPPAGSLQFDAEWRAALTEAIDKCGFGRGNIADRMETLLGGDPEYPISKAMLDAWTAPSKPGWRFPLIYLPAFVEATGAHWLIDRLAAKCGYSVMDQAARDTVTLGEIERDMDRLQQLRSSVLRKQRRERRGGSR